MAKTFEEELEELQDTVSQHEDVLANILWVLFHEESLPNEIKEALRESMVIMYGKAYERRKK